jgi:putative chitinase
MLTNPGAFFNAVRDGILGPALEQGEVDGCNALLKACDGWPLSWTAYALATTYHETAGTMQPIREYGSTSRFMRLYDITGANPRLARQLGNTQPGDGAKFAGRGYVQLTGRANYVKAGAKLGIDLVRHPDLALDPDNAARILRYGMAEGWFTGRSLTSLPRTGRASSVAYINARRIINGLDKATKIAGEARQFEDALVKGGWV